MKRRLLYGLLLASFAACGVDAVAKEAEIKTPTLQCSSCEVTVKNAVMNVEGVKAVNVDQDQKLVRVTYAEGVTDVSKIESVISKAGYQANDKKADLGAYKNLPDCCKVESGAH